MMRIYLIIFLSTFALATSSQAASLNCAEASLLPTLSKHDTTTLVHCFFELRLGEYSERKLSHFFSAALARKLYPETRVTSDRQLVESTIRDIYTKDIKGADKFELENAKGDLLEILESRYSAIFWERARPLINQTKAEAIDKAENAGFLSAGVAFLGTYLSQRRMGLQVKGLSQITSLIIGGSVFKITYDRELSRLRLDGIPPAPSEVLGWNTEGLEIVFDESMAPNAQAYIIGLVGLGLFPMIEGPLRYVWNQGAKTRIVQNLKNRIKTPERCRLLLTRWNNNSPRSYALSATLLKFLFHPVNVASMLTSVKISEHFVLEEKMKWHQETILKGLENIERAKKTEDIGGQRLALRNLFQRMQSYDNLLKQKEFTKLGDDAAYEYARSLADLFAKHLGTHQLTEEWNLWTQKLESKTLPQLRYPSELAIWVAERLKAMGVLDVSLFTYHADHEALILISLLDSSNKNGVSQP